MEKSKYFSLRFFAIIICGLVAQLSNAQNIDHRVYLLGNTADLSSSSKFLDQLEELLPKNEPFTVLINGDLIDTKLTNPSADGSLAKLKKMLEVTAKFDKGRVVVVPGDRDWDNSGKDGLKNVRALEAAVKDLGYDNVEWPISKGCPGPKSVDLSENLVLVTVSTQWWNHPYDKPRPADADCKIVTETDFENELREELEDANGKNLLVAGHFPLISVGEYGGRTPFNRHFAPPIYGSLRAAHRQNIGNTEDIVNKRFDPIREEIEDLIFDKSSTIYASGHEYNLQVLEDHGSFFINSGSPVGARFVGKDKTKVRFAAAITGLIELVYYGDGQVDYVVHQNKRQEGFVVFKKETLLSAPCGPLNDKEIENTAYVPCQQQAMASTNSNNLEEKNVKAIGGQYKASGLKKLIFGKHYRTSWTVPVEVSYLDIYKEKNGLTVYEKGGGRQTTSLKMKGGDGKEYVFRSVDKDPTSVLDRDFRGTIVSETLKDVTSMQHPYGAMVVSEMLNETDILHVNPTLFVLPDDSGLGPFQPKYANLLGMLEEKPINIKKVKIPFAGAEEILQSYKMFRNLYKDNDNKIDKQEYAAARMFDILVGDWGKHEDNWKWAGYGNKDGGMTYRPIPRDRDHVFSRWDGFLPWLVDRKWGKQSGENFGLTINDIRSLTWQSRHSDRFLLGELFKERLDRSC